MYKVGDKVRVTYVDILDSNISEGEVFEVIGTETGSHVRVDTRGYKNWPLRYDQIEKVEESKEMTFPEMAQKLIDGEFEVGTELVATDADNDENTFYVRKNMYGYGISKETDCFSWNKATFPSVLNAKWTAKEEVKEQPTKEMSIEELQKELGYKIKIVESK